MKKTTFVILCLEAMILSFNVGASAALIPSIASSFGISQFLAARLVWIYMLAYGITALFYGPLVKVFNARSVGLVCLFGFSLANLCVGLSRNTTILFVSRFFMGVFGSSVIPITLILIAQKVDDWQRGRLIGIFFSTTFVASLLGLFLSGIMKWRYLYLIPACLGFILWIHMYVYLPSFKDKKVTFSISYLSCLKQRMIISIFMYIFFTSIFYHGIQQWLGVYFWEELGLRQFTISMLITFTSASGIFGEVIGGWFSEPRRRFRMVRIGIILMVLAILCLSFFKAPIFILAVLMVIWGLGWTIIHAGLSTILTDIPKEFLYEAASLNSSVRFLSGGLGVALAGVLMQRSFNLSFLIFGTGLVLFGLFAKNLLIVK